ncbi:MAG: pilus assembly protein PilM [Candidatus Omnitrophica bacterium]|nr:pilus assembly protein PilM [Candidatus Omnitrophota bacterium]
MSNIQTGINIGRHYIEVVQVNKTLSGFQLINQGRINFSDASVKDFSGTGLSSYLRRVLEENHIEPINVVSSIPDAKVILRYFTIPLLPPKERETAIRFEAQKYIPFKMEEVMSSFLVFLDKERKKECKVVFVATKKDVFKEHLAMLKEAYIEPMAVETPSFALMRILRALDLLSKRNLTAVLYIEKSDAVITICDQEIPYLLRDFSLITPLREEVGELGRSEVSGTGKYDSLLREIQLSFDYHYKHFPSLAIEKLVLVGDGFDNWQEGLTKEFKIPVVIAEPAVIFGKKSGISSGFSTSIGLALRGFLARDRKISFLEEKKVSPETGETSGEEKNILKRIFFLELVFGLAIMFFLQITLSRQIKIIKDNLNEVRKIRERIGRELASADKRELERIYQEWDKKKNVFSRMIDRRTYLTSYLSELPRLLPSGLWLEGLRVESKLDEVGNKFTRLTLEGNVFAGKQNKSDSDLVNEFVNNIKNSPVLAPEFKKIELGFIEKNKIGEFIVTRFKITCSK